MPTTYFSRIVIIISAVLVSLFLIFGIPSRRLFDPNLTLIQKTNLKPGIDIGTGTGDLSVPDQALDELTARHLEFLAP